MDVPLTAEAGVEATPGDLPVTESELGTDTVEAGAPVAVIEAVVVPIPSPDCADDKTPGADSVADVVTTPAGDVACKPVLVASVAPVLGVTSAGAEVPVLEAPSAGAEVPLAVWDDRGADVSTGCDTLAGIEVSVDWTELVPSLPDAVPVVNPATDADNSVETGAEERSLVPVGSVGAKVSVG